MISSGTTHYKTDMRFSVIIPCYKVEQYLHQCVDSVLVQTYDDYEVILVDDGSPDGSPAICDEYGEKSDKVKVIHKPNGGLSDARNAGLDMAQGEYIMFLDSDDWWDDKEALSKIDAKIKETRADLVIFGMKKYFAQEDRYGDERIPCICNDVTSTLLNIQLVQRYMQSNIFVACACDKVVSRALIENDRQRFVKHQLSEDIEWCCKLLLKTPQIYILEEAFYVYRQQVSTSITANVGPTNINFILDVINRYVNADTPTSILHFMANQYILLITNLMLLNKDERKLLDADVRKLWWLIKYNWYPYVRLVSKVKFLGYDVIKNLLGFYFKKKRGI